MWDVCADLVLERETVCVYFKTEYVKYFQSYMHNKNLFKIFQFFFLKKCMHTYPRTKALGSKQLYRRPWLLCPGLVLASLRVACRFCAQWDGQVHAHLLLFYWLQLWQFTMSLVLSTLPRARATPAINDIVQCVLDHSILLFFKVKLILIHLISWWANSFRFVIWEIMLLWGYRGILKQRVGRKDCFHQ